MVFYLILLIKYDIIQSFSWRDIYKMDTRKYIENLYNYVNKNDITIEEYYRELADNYRKSRFSLIEDFEKDNPFITSEDFLKLTSSNDENMNKYFSNKMTKVIQANVLDLLNKSKNENLDSDSKSDTDDEEYEISDDKKDKFTLFLNEDSQELFARGYLFERFNISPGRKVKVSGVICYSLSKDDYQTIMNNRNNEVSPYVVEIKTIVPVRKEKTDEEAKKGNSNGIDLTNLSDDELESRIQNLWNFGAHQENGLNENGDLSNEWDALVAEKNRRQAAKSKTNNNTQNNSDLDKLLSELENELNEINKLIKELERLIQVLENNLNNLNDKKVSKPVDLENEDGKTDQEKDKDSIDQEKNESIQNFMNEINNKIAKDKETSNDGSINIPIDSEETKKCLVYHYEEKDKYYVQDELFDDELFKKLNIKPKEGSIKFDGKSCHEISKDDLNKLKDKIDNNFIIDFVNINDSMKNEQKNEKTADDNISSSDDIESIIDRLFDEDNEKSEEEVSGLSL